MSPWRATACAVLLAGGATACGPSAPPQRPTNAAGAGAGQGAPAAAAISAAELRSLRWIEGSWCGSGGGVAPFFERYHFLDDSTLLVESAEDSTFARVTDSTRYELRGGVFGNADVARDSAGGARWVAVRLHDGAVSFAPVRRARNTFVWRPVSADTWVADLAWPPAPNANTPNANTPNATKTGPRVRTYLMRRCGGSR